MLVYGYTLYGCYIRETQYTLDSADGLILGKFSHIPISMISSSGLAMGNHHENSIREDVSGLLKFLDINLLVGYHVFQDSK
jgi:hypothetical protein